MLKHYSMQRKINNSYNGHGPVWEAEQSGTDAGQTAWEEAEFCGPALLGCSWLVRVCAFGTKVLNLREHSDTSLAAFLQSSFASELPLNFRQTWPLLCCHTVYEEGWDWAHRWATLKWRARRKVWGGKVPSLHARGSFLTNLFPSLFFLFLRWHPPSSVHLHAHTKHFPRQRTSSVHWEPFTSS